jgi:hypothetical protein
MKARQVVVSGLVGSLVAGVTMAVLWERLG